MEIDKKKYDKLYALLLRKALSSQELAEKTRLELRTVQRYLKRLQDDLKGTGRALHRVDTWPDRWAICSWWPASVRYQGGKND